MRRRDFIRIIAGLAAARPFLARAQESKSQARVVGVLSSSIIGDDEDKSFRSRLAELGWQEGHNIRYEIRESHSDINRARRFATELVAMKPDVMLATNNQMAQLLLEKTHDMPVVFVAVPDPIGSGLVASFAHPGGMATGFTNFEPSIAGKWLEFLKSAVPGLKRVLVILHAAIPAAAAYEKAITAAAPVLALDVIPAKLNDGPGIDAAVAKFAQESDGGLIVPASALSVFNRDRLVAHSTASRPCTLTASS